MRVSFYKSQQNEEAFLSRNIHRARMFPQCFAVFHTGNIVWILFQDADYTYAARQGILTKIRACEHLQKFCEHEQASTHLIFASNSSKGKILRALSNWMGPFYTPKWITSWKRYQLLTGIAWVSNGDAEFPSRELSAWHVVILKADDKCLYGVLTTWNLFHQCYTYSTYWT